MYNVRDRKQSPVLSTYKSPAYYALNHLMLANMHMAMALELWSCTMNHVKHFLTTLAILPVYSNNCVCACSHVLCTVQ